MSREYFFISDMHIGGDGELQHCDFEAELIEFLQQIEQKQGAELIINGDAFGLWEFTAIEGTELAGGLYFVSAAVRNVIYVPTTLPLHPISS